MTNKSIQRSSKAFLGGSLKGLSKKELKACIKDLRNSRDNKINIIASQFAEIQALKKRLAIQEETINAKKKDNDLCIVGEVGSDKDVSDLISMFTHHTFADMVMQNAQDKLLHDYYQPASHTQLRRKAIRDLKAKVKKITFLEKPGVTIVTWTDGTTTKVTVQPGDKFSKEEGFARCLVKKDLGNKPFYNDVIRDIVAEKEMAPGSSNIKMPSTTVKKPSIKPAIVSKKSVAPKKPIIPETKKPVSVTKKTKPVSANTAKPAVHHVQAQPHKN